MTTYGLTSTGFVPKTTEILTAEISSRLRDEFGSSINVTTGVLAKLTRIVIEALVVLWELAEAVFNSQNPLAAMDAALDALCALTGTTRKPATFSSVTLTLTGVPTTLVPEGSRASTTSTEQDFETDDDATITLLSSWVNTTVYAVGDIRTNSSKVYLCITAGTSAGSGGPTTTAADITDGTVHWKYIGEGTGAVNVVAFATVTGPVTGFAGDITTIETPVGGWQSVYNIEDADLGRVQESNEDLRVRRAEEVATPGTSPIPAIRAALEAIDGVLSVAVFYNNSDVTNADGIPPHSIECMVRGGDDQDIFDALYANVAGGIGTYGTETGTVSDDEGNSHTYMFTRPTELDIYATVYLTADSDYTLDGSDLVKEEIVAWGDAQKTGKDAVAAAIGAQAFKVDGVIDVTEVRVYTDVIATGAAWASATAYSATAGARSVVTNGGRSYICITSGTSAGSGGPTGTDTDITDGTVHWRYLGASVAVAVRELAVYDTSRITVVKVTGTP